MTAVREALQFRLLGEVRAWRGQQELDLGWPKQRALLAVLLLSPGHAQTRSGLVDALWGDDPPRSATNLIHTYVLRLRRVLEPERSNREPASVLVAGAAGYALRVQPDQVDLNLFGERLERARRYVATGEPVRAVESFDRALALWRGTPLAGVTGPFADAERVRLDELRLAAVEERAEAMLTLGRHATLAGELSGLVAEYPLRERLRALLMIALYRSKRRADALALYTETRQFLVDELGVEPGDELRRLHHDILNDREVGLPDPAHPSDQRLAPVVPRQLPAAVRQFEGRQAALLSLTALLDETARAGGTVVISAIDGTAGVGKTAMAVHWAHRVADRFPDGQLYVNLRGFDASGSPMTPAEAVRGFLDALGMPAERIPLGLAAQAALYRSLLAGRRVLVLLDNARDAEQVRPLLPGSPGCLVVVTSRNQLPGLVAVEGAHPLTLDLLTDDEARQLLIARLGRDRVAAEPDAVAEIVAACARLPLALVIVAARAATRPQFPLAVLAGELRETRGGLDAFTGSGAASEVRAVFSWSYSSLGDPAARLFRLLGLHPGPDLATAAAASLADLPERETATLLAELAGAHLVTEAVPGRFTFHDLLRAYATELARTCDSDADRGTALRRLLDHYLYTAVGAARLIDPHQDPIALAPPGPAVRPEPLDEYASAMAWFAVERPVLLAAVHHAARNGFNTHAWQLAWALTAFLHRRGHWHDWAQTQNAALAAAAGDGDHLGQALAHRNLARASIELGRYDDAHHHFRQALKLFDVLDDPTSKANTQLNFGVLLERQKQYREALQLARNALELYRAGGHRSGEARALNNIGWYHALLADYQQSLAYCEQALELHRKNEDPFAEADTWDSIGYAHHHLGDHRQAIACYENALRLCRETGNRYGEADTLVHLGETHRAAGDTVAAGRAWQDALTILDEIGHPDAGEVRARLDDLSGARLGGAP